MNVEVGIEEDGKWEDNMGAGAEESSWSQQLQVCHACSKCFSLIVVQVRTVLEIYAKHGQVSVKQTNIVDTENAYHSLSNLFDQVSADPVHGPKLNKMLKSWAQVGM
jgi:hypothetical protein